MSCTDAMYWVFVVFTGKYVDGHDDDDNDDDDDDVCCFHRAIRDSKLELINMSMQVTQCDV